MMKKFLILSMAIMFTSVSFYAQTPDNQKRNETRTEAKARQEIESAKTEIKKREKDIRNATNKIRSEVDSIQSKSKGYVTGPLQDVKSTQRDTTSLRNN